MKLFEPDKYADFFLLGVILPSILLGTLTVWSLYHQYITVDQVLKNNPQLVLYERELFTTLGKINIFSFSLIILALILILLFGSYLSTRQIKKQLEVTKLKHDFISLVTHELKTPVTAIRLLTERLLHLNPAESAKQSEYAIMILSHLHGLNHLITNILDYSKCEHQNEPSTREGVYLDEFLESAIREYPATLLRPDCKIEKNIEQNLPLFFLDKEMTKKAFLNILANALKFSPPNGIVLVQARADKKQLYLEVTDQGKGIEEKNRSKIFEPFFHTGQGTGLGLTLTRMFTEAQKGKVEFESIPDQGTTFRIILPVITE